TQEVAASDCHCGPAGSRAARGRYVGHTNGGRWNHSGRGEPFAGVEDPDVLDAAGVARITVEQGCVVGIAGAVVDAGTVAAYDNAPAAVLERGEPAEVIGIAGKAEPHLAGGSGVLRVIDLELVAVEIGHVRRHADRAVEDGITRDIV